jgi:hypothetical protein
LFSLTNDYNQPCKIGLNDDPFQAFDLDNDSGPTFGGNGDCCICHSANTTMTSYTSLGSTCQQPHSIEDSSFLASSCEFLLSEIEVYQKE